MESHSLDSPTVAWLRETFAAGGASADREHEASGSLGFGWLHYALVRILRPARALAIGSRQGFIPACIAVALQDSGSGHLDFVDANCNRKALPKSQRASAYDGIGWWTDHRFGPLDPVVTIHLQRTDKFFPGLPPEMRYGYVSIDGGHDYETVRYDFEQSAKRLERGGLIALHDIAYPKPEFGVGRLLRELHAEWEALRFPGLAGLAVLQRRPGVHVREVTYDELAPLIAARQGRYMDPDPPRTWFGAFVEGQVVGCCSVQVIAGHAGVATFRNDYVLPAWRGPRGVYQELFAARLDWCRRHGVEVVTTRCTRDSLGTYRAWGFTTPPDWPDLTPVVGELARLRDPREGDRG